MSELGSPAVARMGGTFSAEDLETLSISTFLDDAQAKVDAANAAVTNIATALAQATADAAETPDGTPQRAAADQAVTALTANHADASAAATALASALATATTAYTPDETPPSP